MNATFIDATHEFDAGRRNHTRHTADNCIALIDGRAYPVHNWSYGGLAIQADERMFTMSAPVDVTMKFRLSSRLKDIPHRGRVVRKGKGRLAIQFEPLTRAITDAFKQVVDDALAREFAESQKV